MFVLRRRPWPTTTAVKFAASGREDGDVLHVGNGRPAYAELQNCRKWATQGMVGDFAREVAKASAGWSRLYVVKWRDKAKADAVQRFAETKVKTYACVVWFASDRFGRGRCARVELRCKSPQ